MKSLPIALSVLFLFGCASSTVIKTLPEGARVEKGGSLLGTTPYHYWDREPSDYSSTYVLKKEGYKDREITLKKDVLYVHRIFAPPLLGLPWIYGYNPEYSFELEKSEQASTQATSPNVPAASPSEVIAKRSDHLEYTQKLRALKQLKDEGLLTDTEYEQKRKLVVDSM